MVGHLVVLVLNPHVDNPLLPLAEVGVHEFEQLLFFFISEYFLHLLKDAALFYQKFLFFQVLPKLLLQVALELSLQLLLIQNFLLRSLPLLFLFILIRILLLFFLFFLFGDWLDLGFNLDFG